MKKIVFSVLCIFLVLTFFNLSIYADNNQQSGLIEQILERGELRVGCALSPLFLDQDPKTGTWSGVIVDMMNQFADWLDVDAVFVSTTWSNMVSGLQARQYDLGTMLTATPERSLVLAFSDPLYYEHAAFVVPSDSNYKSLQDIDKPNIKIASTMGTVQTTILKIEIKNAEIIELPDYDAIGMALEGGRVDAFFADIFYVTGYAKEHLDRKVFDPEPHLVKASVKIGFPQRYTTLHDLSVFNTFIDYYNWTGLFKKTVLEYVDEEYYKTIFE